VIVFVAGMPRAGSMWTYNIVRELYKYKNLIVLPDQIPTTEPALIKEALSSHDLINQVYCIKTHSKLPNPLPTHHQVKIICNYRDVRDAGLSFMRFIHGDYDIAINAMMGMMQLTNYFINTFDNNLFLIRFDRINTEPVKTIDEICDFLELDVPHDAILKIEKKFNKDAVKKHIDKLSGVNIQQGEILDEKQQHKYDAVGNLDGTYIVFDKETSFQSNHITSKEDGEWREYFTEQQREQINVRCSKWLLKYGFEI
jgi:hypothetical protein